MSAKRVSMGAVYPPDKGQGLVEYALILVLVSVLVIAVLLILGPAIGNVFSEVKGALLDPRGGNGDEEKVLLSASAARTGGGSGNDVVVTVSVSRSTTVTAQDSQSGQSISLSCSGACQGTITGVGFSAGQVTVSAEGDTLTAGYPLKNP